LFPMGLTCDFEGKDVPCFLSCSENGSITSHLLAMVMERMDYLDFFPPSALQSNHFLLLYGHGSRFDLPFLEYINDDQHKWTFCIGTPYGTHKWEVGDSSQQKVLFKMEIGKGKMALLKEKTKSGHKFELTKKTLHGCYVLLGRSHLVLSTPIKQQHVSVDGIL
jgi:hypothetical protein